MGQVIMVPIERTIVICEGDTVGPMALEAFLHCLRKNSECLVRMGNGQVPSLIRLSIALFQSFNIPIPESLTHEEIVRIENEMSGALV